jgi:UDP-glucose 4-epimerase
MVIGGAGYIGSHVTRALLDKGYSVTVFDNLSTGTRKNLFDDAQFVKGDILDYPTLLTTMKNGFKALIHLAAFKAAGESMVRPEKYSTNNITGTINILNAASESGVRRFIFSSSAAVYGEPNYLPIDELHPTNPENYYGFTKLEIEELLSWYDRLKNIKYASLRYFNAAGYDIHGRIRGLEKNPENLLPVVMEVAVGVREELEIFGNDYETRDGTCIRDYIHVGDLAEAHVSALEYIDHAEESLIVNLGSEKGVTVQEMVECAREVTCRPIPYRITDRRPGDPEKLVASSAMARRILSWEPMYSDVRTLVSSTWEVYNRHKSNVID